MWRLDLNKTPIKQHLDLKMESWTRTIIIDPKSDTAYEAVDVVWTIRPDSALSADFGRCFFPYNTGFLTITPDWGVPGCLVAAERG